MIMKDTEQADKNHRQIPLPTEEAAAYEDYKQAKKVTGRSCINDDGEQDGEGDEGDQTPKTLKGGKGVRSSSHYDLANVAKNHRRGTSDNIKQNITKEKKIVGSKPNACQDACTEKCIIM